MTEVDYDAETQPQRDGKDALEWALIARIGQGDHAAFSELYKAYFQYLFRFIFKTTRRLDLVEDVINEVMMAVWQQAAQAVPRSRASTWILGIAHYKALQSAAKAGVVRSVNEDIDAPENEVQGAPDSSLEANQLFARALKHLPPEQCAVLELVYHHELHYSEIAVILAVPENTVKTRVFHARRKLRELWPSLIGHPQAELN